MGSVVLLIFSLAILIFQVSCQKSVEAQGGGGSTYTLPPATTSILGGVIVGNGLSVTSNGTLSVNPASGGITQLNKIIYTLKLSGSPGSDTEIWIANYDGTGAGKVNITLPAGRKIGAPGTFGSCSLSPDGQKIFFNVFDGSGGQYLYACNVNGSSPTQIAVAPAGADAINISGAH
mgnify:CR=1 FL=1